MREFEPMQDPISTHRYRVTGLLILLFGITYLDRVCISVAGPRMQDDLHIGLAGWGWVTGIFAISYCLFEIPTGLLGDRIGPRHVLTRIVLWWSAFTALTGAVTGYYPLLVTRFLFGAGEAGAFPNGSIVVSRWYPAARKATMAGVILAASQVGGAAAPLLVVPIQSAYGWRMSFYVLGAIGVLWATIWHVWFRDTPAEKSPLTRLKAAEGASTVAVTTHSFPWRVALGSPSTRALLVTAFCYVYVYNFFQTWFHTFLVRGRGFSEASLWLSAFAYVVAACANLAGGALSDALVRKLGLKRGRRTLGAAALTVAGLFTVAAMFSRQPILVVMLLATVYGAITLQQSVVFGVCLDIGRNHAGAVVALMNTAAQIGGLVGSVAYGYIVARFASYDAPFVPMAALLLLGAVLWLRIDASKELVAAPQTELASVSA
ncbi:MAG TPA: MFS transporter [Steroidobacteraceae bacterium]|nr:MFS transporter [Steroidobacteraceae bacterium]